MSNVHIYGGGTISPIRNHLSLCAPAFGTTAKRLHQLLLLESELHLSKMANPISTLVSNDDVEKHLLSVLNDSYVKYIIMNAALCDFTGTIDGVDSGFHARRLESRESSGTSIQLEPAPKLIPLIKELRPDIKVVGFKTTTDATIDEQFYKAQRMGVSTVIANDTVNRRNMLVTGDTYHIGARDEILQAVCGYIRDDVESVSPIKNIKHSGGYTQYSVRVVNATGRKHAFRIACQIVNDVYGVELEYFDGKWSLHHQDIYHVSTKNINLHEEIL